MLTFRSRSGQDWDSRKTLHVNFLLSRINRLASAETLSRFNHFLLIDKAVNDEGRSRGLMLLCRYMHEVL